MSAGGTMQESLESEFRAAISAPASVRNADAFAGERSFAAFEAVQASGMHTLSRQLLKRRNAALAVECLEAACELDDESSEAARDLGRSYLLQGQNEAATAPLRRARQIRPGDFKTSWLLAGALYGTGRLDKAVQLWREFVQIVPDEPRGWRQLADLQAHANDPSGAIASYRRLLELEPGNVRALGSIADLYERLNRLEDAQGYAAKGLAVATGDPLSVYVLAKCERRAGRVAEALAVLDQVEEPVADRTLARFLSFERANLYDAAGRYDAALNQFEHANAIEPEDARGRFRKQRYVAVVERFKRRFTDEWVAGWSRTPELSERESPVFVVGFPRSGTTLLGHILDGHPQLRTLHEELTLDEVERWIIQRPGGNPEALAELTSAEIGGLRQLYWNKALQSGALASGELLVDKMPLNIVQTGLILRLFPRARFVFLARHPCDACLSCWMQNFKPSDAMNNFATLRETVSLYVHVMQLWRQFREVLPHACHVIRYEDIVVDVGTSIRELLKFLELPWDDGVLEHVSNSRQSSFIRTPSYRQVIQPIYGSARNRWRNYSREFEPLLEQLQPFIELFGYEESFSADCCARF
ncbi:MAG: hypothetical protein CMJ48_10400 [Planctomycetaceae bacterium]|nr:hypothetical protein [Planctomycetaceae bacterium]